MPPNKHGILVAIGVGPKQGPAPPPSVRSTMSHPAVLPSDSTPAGDSTAPAAASQGKVSGDDAGLVTDDQRCGDCQMWHYDTGECDKVEGIMSACAGCRNYFLAKERQGSEEMPGAGEGGEMQSLPL